MNFLRTMLLLAALTALFMTVGYAIGGAPGMLVAFAVAAGTNIFAYWNSDKAVLSQQDAEEAEEAAAPELFGIVRQLTAAAGLSMPRIYIVHADQPNAFATGRNPDHAAVAVSTGLLETLSKDEIAGVLAHELAHVKNRDTLTMTVAATLGGAISTLANFGFMFEGNRDREGGSRGVAGTLAAVILAPLAAAVIQMALSRSREYAADRLGGEISGHPLWLASALEKIERASRDIPLEQAERHPATAPLFIVNPLSGGGLDNLFSTHPSTGNRIALLIEQAREMGQTDRPAPERISDRQGQRQSEDREGPRDPASGLSPGHGPWG